MKARGFTLLAAVAVMGTMLAGCAQSQPIELEVGDCATVETITTRVSDMPTVSCDEEHEAEVYAVFDLDYTDPYEEAAVLEAAELACIDRFEDFVGKPYQTSELDIYYLYPLAEGWDRGDHEVICSVVAPDWDNPDGGFLPLTGTLEGAAR